MAAKIAFVFVCAFVIFHSLEAAKLENKNSGEDYNKLTKPVEDAFFSVKSQIEGLVDKIKASPLYQHTSETVNEGYEKAKGSLTDAYAKIEACKDILNIPATKKTVN